MEYKNSRKDIAWGEHYFLEHVAPSDFDYKAHKKELSPFWESLGFKCSMMFADFYSKFNGIYSDKYIPMDLYYFYILPCLNRFDFRKAYTDKNLYDILFKDINRPKTIIKCINGNYYNGSGDSIKEIDVLPILNNIDCECIIKPTIDSCNGVGIACLEKTSLISQIQSYGKDFIIQEKVGQHHEMNRLNETSLNTLRIHTYRDLNGNVHYVEGKSFCRFGGKGTVKDNVSSGGGAFSINDDGSANDTIIQFKNMQTGSLAKLGLSSFTVPNIEEVKSFAIQLHHRLPHFDFIGWDIAIDKNEAPLFIEFNIEPDIEIPQMLTGVFLGKFYDEILSRFIDVKKIKSNCYRNVFKNGFEYQLIVNK